MEPYATILLKGNPLAMLINALRQCMLYENIPDLILLLVWFIISLLLAAFGVWNIYKNENTYVKVI